MGFHDRTRKYPCNKCGDALITDDGLVKHRFTCGADTIKKPHFCDYCGWKTTQQYYMSNHQPCPEWKSLMRRSDGTMAETLEQGRLSAPLRSKPGPSSTQRSRSSAMAAAEQRPLARVVPALDIERGGSGAFGRQEEATAGPARGGASSRGAAGEEDDPFSTLARMRRGSRVAVQQQIEPSLAPARGRADSGTTVQQDIAHPVKAQRRMLPPAARSAQLPPRPQLSPSQSRQPNSTSRLPRPNTSMQRHALQTSTARWRPHPATQGSANQPRYAWPGQDSSSVPRATILTQRSRQPPFPARTDTVPIERRLSTRPLAPPTLAEVPAGQLSARRVSAPNQSSSGRAEHSLSRLYSWPAALAYDPTRQGPPGVPATSADSAAVQLRRHDFSGQPPTSQTLRRLSPDPRSWIAHQRNLHLPNPALFVSRLPIPIDQRAPVVQRNPPPIEQQSESRSPKRPRRSSQEVLTIAKRRTSAAPEPALGSGQQPETSEQARQSISLLRQFEEAFGSASEPHTPDQSPPIQPSRSASLTQLPSWRSVVHAQTLRLPEPIRAVSDTTRQTTLDTRLSHLMILPAQQHPSLVTQPSSSLQPSVSSQQTDAMEPQASSANRQPVSYPPQQSSKGKTKAPATPPPRLLPQRPPSLGTQPDLSLPPFAPSPQTDAMEPKASSANQQPVSQTQQQLYNGKSKAPATPRPFIPTCRECDHVLDERHDIEFMRKWH